MRNPKLEHSKSKTLFGIVTLFVAVLSIIFLVLKYSGFLDDMKESEISTMNRATDIESTIKFANDGYLGYAILNSKKLQRLLESDGVALNLIDDGGDYQSRVKKLNSGELDMAVMPIHDYLEQISFLDRGKMPLIFGAVSLSTGSDAVLVNPKAFTSINDMKGVHHIKAGFTSKFMLGSMAVDSATESLLKAEANRDIEQTYSGLISGKYDVVGLWEPYITKAKEQGFEVLMSSDELKLGKILDVMVINREFALDNSKSIERFLRRYYESVEYYNHKPKELLSELEIKLGGELSKMEIENSIEGVKFYTLAESAYTLFRTNSSSKYKILDYIDAIVIKLIKMNSMRSNPIEGGDSRNIIYNKPLTAVFNSYDSLIKPKKSDKIYEKLSEKTWQKLIERPKFTRDDLQISFMRDGQLNRDGKSILDKFASQSLNNYDYYIAVVGKSAKVDGISEEVLKDRTTQKAQKVYKYLQRYYQIPKNRIKYIGAGSTLTPAKKENEKYYSYLNRNNKVEILFIDY